MDRLTILINNHFNGIRMDILNQLNDELLRQVFTEEQKQSIRLEEYKEIASIYARIENSIAVLSDMKTNTSYVYYGGAAERLGLEKRNALTILHSIWEEEILKRIHPDDLLRKHLQELRFLHFQKSIVEEKRSDYHVVSNIRMRDRSGIYIPVLHRMFYIASQSNGSIWLALCLYNLSADTSMTSFTINSADGQLVEFDKQTCESILSEREINVLRWIDKGKKSREIAQLLYISPHTVNRHRQNILEKLHVSNSIEACRIAKELRLI